MAPEKGEESLTKHPNKTKPKPSFGHRGILLLVSASLLAALTLSMLRPPWQPPLWAQDQNFPGPKLVFESRTFKFGEVKQGRAVVAKFRFRNHGRQNLRIQSVRPDCGCTAPSWDKKAILPGQSGTITIHFETETRTGAQYKRIAVESNDPTHPRQLLVLSGRIQIPPQPRLLLKPERLQLGLLSSSEPLKSSAFSFIMKNTGAKRLQVQLFQKLDGVVLDEPGPWSLPSEATFIVHGRITTKAHQDGFQQRSIYFSCNDPSQRLRVLTIQAYKPRARRPRLNLSSKVINFGLLPSPFKAHKALSLLNSGQEPLSWSAGPLPKGLSLSAVKGSIAALSSQTLILSWQSSKTGSLSESFEIQSNDPARPKTRVSLGAFSGAESSQLRPRHSLKLSQSQAWHWRAGLVRATDKLCAQLTLVNDTGQDLRFPKRFRGPGGKLSVRRLEAQSLVPVGASVNYVIEGRLPLPSGPFALKTQIPGSPVTVSLTLSGVLKGPPQARLTLSQEAVDFGELAVDAKTKRVLVIGNQGQAPLTIKEMTTRRDEFQPSFEIKPFGRLNIAPGETQALTIQVTGRKHLGLMRGDLVLRTSDPKRSHVVVPISAYFKRPTNSRALRILYSSDEAGEVEPCGCGGKEQLGGLARFATAVHRAQDQVKQSFEGSLLLSAGGVSGGADGLSRRRAQLAYKVLADLGCADMVPGGRDLLGGFRAFKSAVEAAKLPTSSTNLSLAGKPAFVRSRLHKLGTLRVATLAVTNPTLLSRASRADGLKATAMIGALRRELAALKGQADIHIALVHGGLERAREIAEQVPGLQLIIVGFAEELMTRPIEINGVILVANPERGQRLALLDVFLNERGQVQAYRGQDWPLGESFKRDPSALKALLAYRQGLKTLPPVETEAAKDSERFMGGNTKSCADCHEAEVKHWLQTRHAVAMDSLTVDHSHYDPRCTVCHTVGQGQPSGFQRYDLSPKLLEVQCESCHGPARAHALNPRQVGEDTGVAMPKLGLKSCRGCHNGKHSPKFEPQSYWKRVAHGHGALVNIWDKDSNGRLGDDEKSAMKAFQSQQWQAEQARRKAPRSPK